ncbi:MAG: hypothetical protein BroJett040_09450 [Oligoflexia bacterium]|nr:MAG: hypothetical protein BroJett040_09450 [Oligoflexia bacterium]
MKTLLLFQALVVAAGTAALAYTTEYRSAQSFLYGGLLVLLNLSAHGLIWSWIVRKKLIALAVSLIVFKYAIFGVIIFLLVRSNQVDPLWFSLGVGSLLITGIFKAVFFLNRKQ